MSYRNHVLPFALAAVLLSGLSAPVEAQIQRMQSADETTVGLELAKTFIDGPGFSWYTSTFRARLLAPVGETTALLADWGLSVAGTGFGSDQTLSNPEVGLAFLGDDEESDGYLSVVLPLARELGDDDASVGVATLSNFTWLDRFNEDVWSVNAGYTPEAALGASGVSRLNLELVGSLMIPREGGDNELFARYVVGVSQDTPTLRLRADLEGLMFVSEGDLSLGERTIHQIVVGVDGLEGGPGLFVRIPVDDDLAQVDAVVGATFTF